VIRVEPDSRVKRDGCSRRGGTVLIVLGFVYRPEVPVGIYCIDCCEGDHGPRAGFFMICLGDCSGDTFSGDDRLAFGVEARCSGMALTDTPIRDRPHLLGRFVPRQEALLRPAINEFWHVADHICDEDRRARALI
jgi:hypothetical protein